MKHIIYLMLLAFSCMGIWFIEVLIRDWTGLEWLNYWHYASLIIPLLVLFWVVVINGKLEYKKHLAWYPLLFLSYVIFLVILIASYPEDFHPQLWGRGVNEYTPYTFYIPMIFFPVVTYFWNMKLARIEKKQLTGLNKLVLFFSPFIIPVICALITILLFKQSYLFPPTPPDPIKNGLEAIHWAKSGSLIFAFIFYEGIFYLWLKGKLNFKPHLNAEISV